MTNSGGPRKTTSTFHGIRSSERPLVAKSDLALLVELPLLAAAARMVPRHRWEAFCRRGSGAETDAIARQMAIFHTGSEGQAPAFRDLAATALALRREHYMEVLHARRRAGAAPARLVGEEHLAAALREGKGAILWVGHFALAPLATKSALAEAGYDVWHMSRPEHGFSKTRFGIAVLNPIRSGVEARYLAGRVVIDRRNPAAAALRASRLLAENAVVSITAGDWEGARVLHPALGHARLALATGAPALAHASGAPILPLMATRDAPGDPVDVVVEAPIAVDRSLPRATWIDAATEAFVARLAPYVERHPAQWRGWGRLRIDQPVAGAPGKSDDPG